MAGKPGRSGRRPTPTAILKLRQTYRDDRHGGRANEPRPRAASLKPPTWLTGRGRRVWASLAPELVRTGVLKVIDVCLFAALCVEIGHYIEAVLHPGDVTVSARLKLLSAVKDIGGLFGLDPTSRTRLRVNPSDEPDLAGLISAAISAGRKEQRA